LNTQVLIVGGGVTGVGLARDLALRGVRCVVVEKEDVAAGASGGNHGLLHSGARYIGSDPDAARECREENEVLKRLAPHCIEDTGGLFVAMPGDDESYVADFPSRCQRCGISVEPLPVAEAREREPSLSPEIVAAYAVADATIDPFRLALDNMAHARTLGARLLTRTQVAQFVFQGNRIATVKLTNTRTGDETTCTPDIVVNAAGAWAGKVAGLAGLHLPMVFSKGSMVISQERWTRRVVNRLRLAADGDIVVPGGTVSILGTTSVRVPSPDGVSPEIDEVDAIIDECSLMVPALATARYIRAYCGVRPLIEQGAQGDDRNVSRGYVLADHEGSGVANLITITGGKLTTFRLMAEKAADLVCRRLGVEEPCRTRREPLPESSEGRWSEAGRGARLWAKEADPGDSLLCECEMVPRSAVDDLVATLRDQKEGPVLPAIGLRSRVGKGPCQGNFCSQRITAHLYHRREVHEKEGIDGMIEFLQERWHGKRPLLWGQSLVQYEFQEALHCGLFGLELHAGRRRSEEGSP